MNIISNQEFSHDSVKYVYQDNPNAQVVNQGQPPTKPFKVTSPDRSAKTKKDLKKEKKQDKKTRPFDLMSDL